MSGLTLDPDVFVAPALCPVPGSPGRRQLRQTSCPGERTPERVSPPWGRLPGKPSLRPRPRALHLRGPRAGPPRQRRGKRTGGGGRGTGRCGHGLGAWGGREQGGRAAVRTRVCTAPVRAAGGRRHVEGIAGTSNDDCPEGTRFMFPFCFNAVVTVM